MAKTNLIEVDDYPEVAEATPRFHQSSPLWVENIDIMKTVNTQEHRTSRYKTNKLVVRRGQKFIIQVSFSQDVSSDDVHLEFLIGECERSVTRSRRKQLLCWSFV